MPDENPIESPAKNLLGSQSRMMQNTQLIALAIAITQISAQTGKRPEEIIKLFKKTMNLLGVKE